MMTSADDRDLPLGADAQQIEAVAQHADRERADQRADDAAAALLERGAAENDRRDGVELQADADGRVRGVHSRGHDEGREPVSSPA